MISVFFFPSLIACYTEYPSSSLLTQSVESVSNVGNLGSIPRLGRSPGEGNGNPLQYSCLENPMDGGAWWATVHGHSKSRTRLSDLTFTLTFKMDCMSADQH